MTDTPAKQAGRRRGEPVSRQILLTFRFWAAPVALVLLVMSTLAALYMGGLLDPTKNLHDFPVAVVNQDEGDNQLGSEPPQHVVIGDQIVDGLKAGIDPAQIDLRMMGPAAAQQSLSDATSYGAIFIPSDFTKRLMILAAGSLVPGEMEKPVITVYTNPRAGTLGANIANQIGQRAMTQVQETVGKQLTDTVKSTLAQQPGDLRMSGAAELTLQQPIDVRIIDHNPLPDGTGYGLAAFYYALLLVLAGFTGATIISQLTDGLLGFTPTEIGPLYLHNDSVRLSRFQTTLVKWVITVIVGLAVSGVYVGIGHWMGLPITNALALWLYGALAITAVGVTSIAVMAVFGNVGLLINLFIFIIVGLPSSGGTIPLQATPPLYQTLADWAPMHQVYLATRALLFFDANPTAGLMQGAWITVLGLFVGLLFGALITLAYDRHGLQRRHAGSKPRGQRTNDEIEPASVVMGAAQKLKVSSRRKNGSSESTGAQGGSGDTQTAVDDDGLPGDVPSRS